MTVPLFTIGYERAASADFVATLGRAGIRTAIDVRDLPLSRRAGFSKRQLAASLAEAGIVYVHLRALGTPPEGREANRRRLWDRFWDIVEARLGGAEAQHDLSSAVALAVAAPSCLICYEADWRHCHRKRVAELMAERHDFEIRHLDVTMGEPSDSEGSPAS